MDYSGMQFWLSVINALATAGLTIYVRHATTMQAKESALAAFRADVDTRLDKTENRLVRLEGTAHSPSPIDLDASDITEMGARIAAIEASRRNSVTHADLAKIYDRMDGVSQTLHHLHGRFSGIERIVNDIDSFLREAKR